MHFDFRAVVKFFSSRTKHRTPSVYNEVDVTETALK